MVPEEAVIATEEPRPIGVSEIEQPVEVGEAVNTAVLADEQEGDTGTSA